MAKYETILRLFPPETVEALMEFVKYIAKLEDDYIVFMARKSYCLYKVLINASLKPSQKIIASDRIFDLDIPILKNKSIALVDDTLIIGTTLAEIKDELEKKYEAKVTVHVLAVDDDNWNRDIVQPNKIFLKMKNHELMTFCTSLARVLYVSAMPYIVDFPVTKKKKLKINQLDAIISSVKYNFFDLTNEFQKENHIRYYTLIPDDLKGFVNNNLLEIIQLFKLRLFVELCSDDIFVTIVPIITLKSISIDDLHKLFSNLLIDIQNNSLASVKKIEGLFLNDKSKLRLLQYLLSCKLLWSFINDIEHLIGVKFKVIFDKSETQAHFGFSNYELMNDLELASFNFFRPESMYTFVEKAELPENIISMADEFFNEINQEIDKEADLYIKFTEIFVKFFDKREKPFRKDAKEMGKKVLFNKLIPSQNRLKIGLPFEIIEKKMRESSNNDNFSLELSLILDTCNDLGIAVPVTCIEKNVIFRAYRHGEDVKITQELISLIYHLIEGYLASPQKTYITQIPLQKIIVLFIKYGIKDQLFMPIRSVNSYDNNDKLSIEYDLKGAIPRHHFQDEDGNKTNEYLTKYLLRKNILKKIEKDQIVPGDKEKIKGIIETNYIKADAPDKAFMFGLLFGRLVYERSSDDDKPITINDLIILATCDSTLNTLKAIHYEIGTIISWIKKKNLDNITWNDNQLLKETSRNIMRAHAYEAFNSAKFKYRGYVNNRNQETINRTCEYLESKNDIMALRFWQSIWRSYSDIRNEDEIQFRKHIEDYIRKIIDCQLYIKIILFCIKYKITNGKRIISNIRNLENDLKMFIDPINEKLNKPYNYNKILERLEGYCKSKNENFFPYKETFNHYANKLFELCTDMVTQYTNCKILLKKYGNVNKRHDYQYMIWYDIIDSTSSKVQKRSVSEHSKNVESFIKAIPPNLEQVQIMARKNKCDLYSYRGDFYSDDDGKHIFLAGQESIFIIPVVLKTLLETAACFQINLRLLIISTDFVSSPVYREIDKTEVEGNRFFIYCSRVKKQIELEEEAEKNRNGDGNFLMILDENLHEKIKYPNNTCFDTYTKRIVLEIEQISSRYNTICGSISIK